VKALVQACLILGLVIFVLVVLAAGYGYYRFQAAGVLAALLAGVVCGVPALGALIVTVCFAGGDGPRVLTGLLGGIFLRTGAPLAGLTFLPNLWPQLAQAGLAAMILGIYLPILSVETLLAVRLTKQQSTPRQDEKIGG